MMTGHPLYLIEVKDPRKVRGRGRYWRPESAGYTNRLEYAGLYAPDDPMVSRHLPGWPEDDTTHSTAVPIPGTEGATLGDVRSFGQWMAELIRGARQARAVEPEPEPEEEKPSQLDLL